MVVPDRCFVRELAGETAPSFSTMERLYGLASELYGLRPWRLIDESQLILVRDSASGEVCYCSVMGMLGEVYSILTRADRVLVQSKKFGNSSPSVT